MEARADEEARPKNPRAVRSTVPPHQIAATILRLRLWRLMTLMSYPVREVAWTPLEPPSWHETLIGRLECIQLGVDFTERFALRNSTVEFCTHSSLLSVSAEI